MTPLNQPITTASSPTVAAAGHPDAAVSETVPRPETVPVPVPVPVQYEYSTNLPALLEQLDLSLVVSTYQAGKLITIGSHQGQLVFGFAAFPQVMGVCRTPSGLAIGSRETVWTLPASREIAPALEPIGQHDMGFLTRQAHCTGPLLGHDLAYGAGQLWLVNTAFNCLCTLEPPWSFTPRWLPPFICELAPGDRCHLNGLAMADNWGGPAYVTAHGRSDSENGWRQTKANGGCLIDVAGGEVLADGLSMPHSPRLHQGQLYLLNSGHGTLCRWDSAAGQISVIAQLPGFTRGLDCWGGHAAVGLSRIRESAVFGGLPVSEAHESLRCGVALVNCSNGEREAHLWFNSGVEEIYAVSLLPGVRNPVVIGPEPERDGRATPWLVPPLQPIVRQAARAG